MPLQNDTRGVLLALDLGTKTGYKLGTAHAALSGVIDLKGSRFDGGGARFLRLRRWLDEMHAASPIREVVFEEVRRHLSTDSAHVYGGLLAIVSAWCESQRVPVPYQGVPVQTIKKFATGKGNASKTEVIVAVREWGHRPKDDNEADAVALFHYWLTETARAEAEMLT